VDRDADQTAEALARLYDLDLADDPGDLDLYLALAERGGGPILELGVGSGRLAVPLAEAGWQVTGVDRDPAMLERARRRAEASGKEVSERLELVHADIEGLDLGAGRPAFKLAFIALNSLMLLPGRAAQASALRTLAKHLAPGGLAVADVWLPDGDDLERYDGRLILEYAREDEQTGHTVVKTAAAVHESTTGTVTMDNIYDEFEQGKPPVRWLRRDHLRLVSADDLRDFAEQAGLHLELLAGGYDLEPLAPGSERAILIATRE